MLPEAVVNGKIKQSYYEKGNWSTTTVFEHFLEAVKKYPKHIAVVDKSKKVSYELLFEKVNLVSAGLQNLQVKKGDIVSVQLPNWVENVIVYLACTKIGAIYNPIPATARFQEVKYILSLCESKVLFIPEKFRSFDYIEMLNRIQTEINIPQVVIVNGRQASLDLNHSFLLFDNLLKFKSVENEGDVSPITADDPLVVLFTSGTESQPKGVVHTHNTILFVVRSMINTLSITIDDAVFMPSPLSHATGFLYGMNLPLIIGAKSVLMEHFSAKEALETISVEKCTFSMGATPFLHDILQAISALSEEDNLTHFRFFLCGGAPIPRHLVSQATNIGFKVLAVYGSSESPPHTVSRLDDSDEFIFSFDGKPLPDIEVKIVDDNRVELLSGEIGEEASRGPNVFLGYFKQPEMTEKYLDQDGWFYSGDLCVKHPNNYIKVVGRKKDIIIRGGQNISPSEVEDILYKHPKVQNVVVVGVPDERMGEKALALVVPKEGQIFTFEEMIEFLSQQNIAKFKYPEQLRLLKEFPKTPSGKIQKYKLRELFIGK